MQTYSVCTAVGGRGGHHVWIPEDTKAFLLTEVCSESLRVAETDATKLKHGSNSGKPNTLPAPQRPSVYRQGIQRVEHKRPVKLILSVKHGTSNAA